MPLLILTAGCAHEEQPVARVPSDLSSPKSAAVTFLKAIAAGDAATAREAAIGTPQEKQWIDAMASLVNGLRHYDQVLLARFGGEAVPTDVDLRQALQTLTQDPIMHAENGIVSESQDTALIYPAIGGIKLAAHAPMSLRRQGKNWKVDLSAMANEPRYGPEVTGRYRAAGKALSDAARRIRAGQFRTLEEAEQSVSEGVDLGSGG